MFKKHISLSNEGPGLNVDRCCFVHYIIFPTCWHSFRGASVSVWKLAPVHLYPRRHLGLRKCRGGGAILITLFSLQKKVFRDIPFTLEAGNCSAIFLKIAATSIPTAYNSSKYLK